VPRGSFQPQPAGVFSSLGRLILDCIDRGVILLDESRRVHDANTLGRRVLADGNGIKVRAGRFAFIDAGLDRRLSQLIDRYCSDEPGDIRGIAALVRHKRSPPYCVAAVPVPRGVDERGVAFVIFIYGPRDWRSISVEILRQVYGLTRAQAEVARQLFAGQSVEQAAVELGLSANTVRTHLKQIFTRCDVRSQRELLYLLATGPNRL